MKRIFDVLGALVLIVLLMPLMAAIALAVRISMGAPVIFAQQRPGLRGRPFWMYKFRTMRDARDARGRLLSDEERTSALGCFLRRASLDELPELFNVLRGDMSFVGPRPLLMVYLDHYTPEQQRRHGVRPGVTGWAQINGRNHLSWDQKLALDVWYVDNASFWLDLRILFKTFATVIGRKGTEATRNCLPTALQGCDMDELLRPSKEPVDATGVLKT